MNIITFGGGVNSTAMLVGLHERQIPVDLILFADTGAELPHTYRHIQVMNEWLHEHNMPRITVVEYCDQAGDRLTLERECLQYRTLPSIVFGYKKCSQKHKIGPQDKFCNHHSPCVEVWASDGKINKFIGYDAGETGRQANALVHDLLDKKYVKVYPLIDWGWFREDCVTKIQQAGLPLPDKSSCFFCPSMKKAEIKALRKTYPELYERAIQMEENARDTLYTVKGLGRSWSWKKFVEASEAQLDFFDQLDSITTPCGCYDG